MIALAFLMRILGALIGLVVIALIILLVLYGVSWVIIGLLTAVGLNNSLVVKWLKSHVTNRKSRKKK